MGNTPSSTSSSVDPGAMYTATATASIAAARATALTLSPTSNVKGKTFDRFVQIFLENQDFDIAAGDPNLAYLATKGILLDNYYAITHPSQPNYVAAGGASTHGVTNDNFVRINADTETIVDLLEAAQVSWSLYQEDMPYSGFEGSYVNQKNGANDYVRKHNPLISYDSVSTNVNRLAKTKNFTLFDRDLAANTLPQWMFITPNMSLCLPTTITILVNLTATLANDGHDTDVTVAGKWARSFLEPLLSNNNFNIGRTLIILTFDECENYSAANRVFTVLLGSAIPSNKIGTTDSTQYNHYSLTKTVENNWALGDLGENDVSAVPFF
ncbi:phosphoesterase family-domain-containing protein [Xylariaceae sp. FL1651]|nr:phosphoesterase family-domain-containing protein [Xylariaceae sp. FL1651]